MEAYFADWANMVSTSSFGIPWFTTYACIVQLSSQLQALNTGTAPADTANPKTSFPRDLQVDPRAR